MSLRQQQKYSHIKLSDLSMYFSTKTFGRYFFIFLLLFCCLPLSLFIFKLFAKTIFIQKKHFKSLNPFYRCYLTFKVIDHDTQNKRWALRISFRSPIGARKGYKGLGQFCIFTSGIQKSFISSKSKMAHPIPILKAHYFSSTFSRVQL